MIKLFQIRKVGTLSSWLLCLFNPLLTISLGVLSGTGYPRLALLLSLFQIWNGCLWNLGSF